MQNFKSFMIGLCAAIAGTAFLKYLAKIKEMKKQAHGPKTLDKMLLKHHSACAYWIACDCYMSWINKDLKELHKYREQSKKQEIW